MLIRVPDAANGKPSETVVNALAAFGVSYAFLMLETLFLCVGILLRDDY